MSTLGRTRIRLAGDAACFDAPLDANRRATPQFWRGNDVQFEIAVFYCGVLLDVSNLASVTLEIRPPGDGGGAPDPEVTPLMGATVTSFDNATTLNTWNAGTHQHAVVAFTAAQGNIPAGAAWLSLFVITNDNPGRVITLCAGPIRVMEDGSGLATEPDPVEDTFYTAAQSDGRFAIIGGAGGGAPPSNANPHMDGTVAPGTSTAYSRADHVHPTDTSRAAAAHASQHAVAGSDPVTLAQSQITGLPAALALLAPLASPTFTGTVTITTVAGGSDSSTKAASTAFVQAAIAAATISESQITNLTSDLAAKAPLASPALTGTPTVPTVGTASDSTTKAASTAFVQAAIAAATISESQITNLNSDLALKAPLASPGLTGTPTGPTATAGTNNTQLASTAFVQAAIAAVVSSAPNLLNTLAEIDAALNNDPNFAATMTTSLALKAPLASPGLTGTPTGPTAAVDTNTTQLATTAFVLAQAASATPLIDGTAAVGTSTRYARADHVHPTDTSRAPLASPTFTGTVTITTVAGGSDSSTKAASTAFVQAAIAAATLTESQITNLTSDLAAKAPLASPTFTGTVTTGATIQSPSGTGLTITSAGGNSSMLILATGNQNAVLHAGASGGFAILASAAGNQTALSDTSLFPVTDAQLGLGDSTHRWTNLFLSGTANVSAITGAASATLYINGGTGNSGVTILASGNQNAVLHAGASGGFAILASASGNQVSLSDTSFFSVTDAQIGLGTSSSRWASVFSSGAFSSLQTALATTSTDGLILKNSTAALVGAQVQYSPRLYFEGQGWKTNATAASQSVAFYAEVRPVAGAANPSGNWVLASKINAGTATDLVTVSSAGVMTLASALPLGSGGTGFSTYTTGDLIYASGTNTLAKRAAGTDGYVLTMVSGVPAWAAASGGLPSQTGNNGYFLTTNGTTASWIDPAGYGWLNASAMDARFAAVLSSISHISSNSLDNGDWVISSASGDNTIATRQWVSDNFVHQ